MQVVEEFMSIADGQLVLQAPASSTQSSSQQNGPASWQALTGSNVDVSTSVSRIGCRAYPAAMAGLAPSIRFDLAQAADALKFASSREPSELQQQQLQRAALLQAALAQQPRQPVPVDEQVTMLPCFCMGRLMEHDALDVFSSHLWYHWHLHIIVVVKVWFMQCWIDCVCPKSELYTMAGKT